MLRRQFLGAGLAALAAAGGPATSLSALAGPGGAATTSPTATDSWKEAFRQALAEHPQLLGYHSVQQASFEAPAEITGHWPEAVRGMLYRNGPAGHEVGGFRYRHWFDGDGMLQAWRIGPDGVSHRARMIETHKYRAEQAEGRALYPGFGSRPPEPRPVTSADAVNPGNISVLPHGGRLLALWEAGSPWEMDPDSLATRGLHRFSPETAGVPFSAHPRVEPDGTLWNFGYASSAGLVVLWHLDSQGRVVKMGKVPVAPMGMPHDFIVTERHIVLMISPFHFEPDGPSSFLHAHRWHPERATRLLLVDKNDFSSHRWLELPSQWVFHFGNGWEDSDGIIHFDGARAPDPHAMTDTFREIMRGQLRQTGPSQYYRYRVDTRTGTASEEPLLPANVASEFPAVDPRLSCRRHRYLTLMTGDNSSGAPGPALDSVSVLDVDSGRLSSWRYPVGQTPEEHLYLPGAARPGELSGWVLGSALDWRRGQTLLNLFRAEALSDGPVATATLPYALPLGLHAKFVTG